MNYREAWANGEIEAGALVDRLEEQAREIERLKEGQDSLILVRDDYKKQVYDYRARWASAIASGNAPVGAIEAIRAEFPLFDDADLDQEAHHCEWSVQHDRKRLHALLDGLNQQPASGGDDAEEAFEEYARPLGFDLTVPKVGDYTSPDTLKVWHGFKAGAQWQARAALPVREAVAEDSFTFQYRHAFSGETRTVSMSRAEVANGMDDTLFEKLVEQICECQPVGETNVVDCNCSDYAENFDLVAAPSPSKQGGV